MSLIKRLIATNKSEGVRSFERVLILIKKGVDRENLKSSL